MSRSWARGSTPQWRKLRARILQRDNHTCQIKLPGCTTHATCVHHIKGKAYGDDPHWLCASCAHCNLHVGDPLSKKHDPQPKPTSSW